MDSLKLLGVRIDKVNLTQAVVAVDDWLGPKGDSKTKKTISTPNFEFLIDAQKDFGFREILNKSDLNIPDSARFGWLAKQLSYTSNDSKKSSVLDSSQFIGTPSNNITPTTNIPRAVYPEIKRKGYTNFIPRAQSRGYFSFIYKFLHWFAFPFADHSFPNTTGVELVEALCQLSSTNGYTVGFLGGQTNTAAIAAAKMVAKYPGLQIAFADPGGKIDLDGHSEEQPSLPKDCDILFVAFGHRKQEKWIDRYKTELPARVLMGVGGSFDYLSGRVPRAPAIFRSLGLEWLFRLILQPWRIQRQLKIVGLVLKLI